MNLTTTPNPVLKGSVVRVDGSGFPVNKTRFLLDGVGATTNILRPAADGSFHCGIGVASTVRVQTLVAQQQDAKGKWVVVATAPPIKVVTAAPPPADPPPPPTGLVAKWPGTGAATQATFLALLANMAIDTIEIAAGTYRIGSTRINIDRSARPLTVRPAPGAAVIFDGGQFYFGLGGHACDLHFLMAGVVFENLRLGATGVVWMGNCERITFNNPAVRKVVVTDPALKANNTWALYLSIDANHSPQDIVADDWTVEGSGRNFSALQVGHPPSVMANIKARGWTVSEVDIAIYAYSTVTGLVVDDWQITDSRRDDRDATVFFGPSVKGVYSNIRTVRSGGLESKGGMTDGGGNVWP